MALPLENSRKYEYFPHCSSLISLPYDFSIISRENCVPLEVFAMPPRCHSLSGKLLLPQQLRMAEGRAGYAAAPLLEELFRNAHIFGASPGHVWLCVWLLFNTSGSWLLLL